MKNTESAWQSYKGWIIFAVVFAILFVTIVGVVSWLVGTYNQMVIAKVDVNTQWSNVKTEYQRRADLMYNIVETTKGYAIFEHDTMTDVIKARAGAWGNNKAEEMSNVNSVDQSFLKMMMLTEQYPQLKSNELFLKQMGELQNTEDRVQIARNKYNDVVRDYNVLIKRFPAFVLANMYGFDEEDFFINEESSNVAPKINMSMNRNFN